MDSRGFSSTTYFLYSDLQTCMHQNSFISTYRVLYHLNSQVSLLRCRGFSLSDGSPGSPLGLVMSLERPELCRTCFWSICPKKCETISALHGSGLFRITFISFPILSLSIHSDSSLLIRPKVSARSHFSFTR